jgi:cell pole-organizing protein PopZ
MSVAPAPMKPAPLDDERRAHEPSMEEILASIRRIIADDDALSSRRDARRQEAPQPIEAPLRRPTIETAYPSPALDSFDAKVRLSRGNSVEGRDRSQRDAEEHLPRRSGAELAIFPSRAEPAIRDESPEAEDAEEQNDSSAMPGEIAYNTAEPAGSEDAHGHHIAEDEDDALEATEPETAKAAPAEAIGARGLVSPEAAASVASHFEALATSMFINDSGLLQEYAKEMLRPMLKQWLDDNLPVMVERLVRAEIERVARGRR